MKRSGPTSVTHLLVGASLLLAACSGSDGGADVADPGLAGSTGDDSSGSGGTLQTSGAAGSVTQGGGGGAAGASGKAGSGGSAGAPNTGGSAGSLNAGGTGGKG